METNLLLTSPETHINIIFILVAKLGIKTVFLSILKMTQKAFEYFSFFSLTHHYLPELCRFI